MVAAAAPQPQSHIAVHKCDWAAGTAGRQQQHPFSSTAARAVPGWAPPVATTLLSLPTILQCRPPPTCTRRCSSSTIRGSSSTAMTFFARSSSFMVRLPVPAAGRAAGALSGKCSSHRAGKRAGRHRGRQLHELASAHTSRSRTAIVQSIHCPQTSSAAHPGQSPAPHPCSSPPPCPQSTAPPAGSSEYAGPWTCGTQCLRQRRCTHKEQGDAERRRVAAT